MKLQTTLMKHTTVRKFGLSGVIFVFILSFLHCGEDSRMSKMEADLEQTTLIAYQLIDDNAKLKKKLRKLEKKARFGNINEDKIELTETGTKMNEEDVLKALENSKRKLFVMRMKIMNYQLQNETYPETIQDLKELLGTIPLEDRSGKNVIHLGRNGRGGWIYDPDEGEMDLNSFNR